MNPELIGCALFIGLFALVAVCICVYNCVARFTEKDEKDKPVSGVAVRVRMPPWFMIALYINNTGSSTNTLRNPAAGNISEDAALIQAITDGFAEDVTKLIKSEFLIKYKQAVTMTFVTKLYLTYNNKPFLPGKVCSITDDNGDELLRGYITNILHVVDINSKQAQTEISMRYVRSSKFKLMDSKDGVKKLHIWE